MVNLQMAMDGSGGTVTEVDGYRIHTFTMDGTFTTNVSGEIEYLIVAGGGGGGGRDIGGGGGAGGMKTGNTLVIAGSYLVIVGLGGGGLKDPPDGGGYSSGNKGNNSSFNSIECEGGGAGRVYNHTYASYISGGSGGGGAPTKYQPRCPQCRRNCHRNRARKQWR